MGKHKARFGRGGAGPCDEKGALFMKRLFFIVYFLLETIFRYRYWPYFPAIVALADLHVRYGSAIETVVYSCGHAKQKRLVGDRELRKDKLIWFRKNAECVDCHLKNYVKNRRVSNDE